MRRGSIVQLTLLSCLYGGIAALVAILIPWLPDPASREAGRIWFVYWFTTVISITVFSVVAAVLTYSLIHFRARPDDDSDGPPVHGHTTLEIVWTAIPAALVTAISILSAVVLAENGNAGATPLRITVTAQQYAWRFEYANGLRTGELRLPLKQKVELSITAADVLHSFWVPQFAQKQDAVPGKINKLVITPTKLGRFPVVCTELCGLGHSLMRATAIVMEPADFDKWLQTGKTTVSSGGAAAGQAVFNNEGCGGCHTLKAADSNGTTGPDLDKLPELAKQAGQPLEQFVRESIVKPDAYVEKGYQPVMPKEYGDLPKDQLDALVTFLVGASTQGTGP